MNHSSKSRSRSPIDQPWYLATTSSSDSSPHPRSTVVEGELALSTVRTRSGRRRHQELLEDTTSRTTRARSRLRRSPRSLAPVTASHTMDRGVAGGSSALSFNTEGSDNFGNAGPKNKLLRDRVFNGADTAIILTTDSNADDDCAICRDRKVNQSYLLPCMHTYCYQCILQWVRINPTCPLCKALVQKIIHSINSDNNFKEYDIRSSPRNVINLMTPIVNFLNTNLHRSSLAVSNASDTIFHSEPRSTLLMTLVVRALRTTTINPNLLRRLVYVNKFYTYPTPLPTHSSSVETLSCLSRCTSRSFLAENEALQTRLIDFTQRELFYLAPWVDYMNSSRGAVALQPLGAGNSNPSEALGRLSMAIVRRIASHLVPLTRVDDFADAIRGMDDRDQGGDGLLESVSISSLKHFSWELLQFARFSGTLQEYYSQSCLYANHFTGGHMRLEHSPQIHTAVYTTPRINGVAAGGFANSLEGVSKETAQWLFRHLFNAPRSPFMSFTLHPDENIIRVACQALQSSASYNPSRLINSNDSVYHLRRHGIRGLLSRMAEQTWSDEVAQMGLCELIDQARIGSAMERLTHQGRHLVLRRMANLIGFFSQPTYAVRPNTPLPSVEPIGHGEPSQAPLRLFRPHATSLREPNSVTIALGEGNSETEGGDDEAIIVSDSEESSTQHSQSGRSSIPRCCVEHRKHCCCCYRRRSTEHMTPTEFAHMFKAFIEFYEERRSRRRLRPQMLNRPSSPIVISDDDEEEDEAEPQPGPSRPLQKESPQQTPPRQPIKVAEENSVGALDELPSVIIRPTTANEFYSLLHQALDCDKQEVPNASVPKASSSQPVVKQEEEPKRPPRPLSAPLVIESNPKK
uniref:RING-type E3 ubiquitin transferase n=1 Tax=Echinococcus granulosus TaxID=6210 RepID=A0A068WIP1_ECHGR|nr:transcriptional activator [Echinococcus granulosus]